MKGLVEEYGRIIIMVIIATVMFTGVLMGISLWYQDAFPELSQGNLSTVRTESLGPVLLVEPIEYKKGTNLTENMIKAEAKGYKDASLTSEAEITVVGLDGVDINSQGLYQIMLMVVDDFGQRFHKLVPILIY